MIEPTKYVAILKMYGIVYALFCGIISRKFRGLMDNLMCQLDWAKEFPALWSNVMRCVCDSVSG